MQMTNEEIVRSYKEAKHKKEQVGILAELNTCTRDQIIDILRAGGVSGKGLGPSKPIKSYTATELTGTKECDFTAITARIEELLRQRDVIEHELSSISETMSALLLKMKEGGSDD